eukprot:g1022.t1
MYGKLMSTKPEDIRLIAKDQQTIYEDEAKIGDQEVQTNDIVYAVFQQGNGWEKIQVVEGKTQAKKQ